MARSTWSLLFALALSSLGARDVPAAPLGAGNAASRVYPGRFSPQGMAALRQMPSTGLSKAGAAPAGKIGLAFNIDPKWLGDKSPKQFLLPLRKAGLTALEFPLDPRASDWKATKQLIKESQRLGFKTVLHLAYKAPYNPAGFAGAKRDELVKLYGPALTFASQLSKKMGRPVTVVVHGASGPDHRRAMEKDTVEFLNWVTKNYKGVRPAFELLGLKEEGRIKVGDNKKELVRLTNRCSSKTGVCWDMGHDVLGGTKPIPAGYVKRVTHVHLHDIMENGKDHAPLRYGNVPYKPWLDKLKAAGFEGTVTLELKGANVAATAKALHQDPTKLLAGDLRKVRKQLDAPVKE